MALEYIPSDKAPGPDGIKTWAIKKAWKCEEFKKRFTALVSACVNMGYHPHLWRTSCTVVIPKPNKDKHEVRAYRPIALLNTMGKVVEKIVQRRLAYLTEDSLPPNQYGARHGFSAPDAVTKLVQDITSTRQFTSSMMIDIQGAFDNVHKDTLLDILKKLKLPSTAIRWVYHFMSERSTSLIIDGTPYPNQSIRTGIPQGSPVSPLLFLLYSAPLYKIVEAEGAKIIGFVDDVTISVQGDSLDENTEKLSGILTKCDEWARSQYTKLDLGDKLNFIHFLNRRRSGIGDPNEWAKLRLPNGDMKAASKTVKLLGITLDHRLTFKEHLKQTEVKALRAIDQIWRLGGCYRGMSVQAVRQLYLGCVLPIIEYGATVWKFRVSDNDIESLQKIQNVALRRILGAIKTTPIQAMHVEAGIMPIRYRLLQTTLRQGMRILYKLHPKNPLRNETISPPQETPLGKLKSLLAKRHAFRTAVEVCLSEPPWKRHREPDIETDKEWNRIIDLRKEVKYTIELWQANYSSDVESGKTYIQMVKEEKYTIYVRRLRMFDLIQAWPRYVPSKLVQFRTGRLGE
jgi:hypothetical protein